MFSISAFASVPNDTPDKLPINLQNYINTKIIDGYSVFAYRIYNDSGTYDKYNAIIFKKSSQTSSYLGFNLNSTSKNIYTINDLDTVLLRDVYYVHDYSSGDVTATYTPGDFMISSGPWTGYTSPTHFVYYKYDVAFDGYLGDYVLTPPYVPKWKLVTLNSGQYFNFQPTLGVQFYIVGKNWQISEKNQSPFNDTLFTSIPYPAAQSSLPSPVYDLIHAKYLTMLNISESNFDKIYDVFYEGRSSDINDVGYILNKNNPNQSTGFLSSGSVPISIVFDENMVSWNRQSTNTGIVFESGNPTTVLPIDPNSTYTPDKLGFEDLSVTNALSKFISMFGELIKSGLSLITGFGAIFTQLFSLFPPPIILLILLSLSISIFKLILGR